MLLWLNCIEIVFSTIKVQAMMTLSDTQMSSIVHLTVNIHGSPPVILALAPNLTIH